MKKRFLISIVLLSLLVCLVSVPVFAENPAPSTVLSINPLSILIGNFNLTSELPLGPKSSVLLGGHYWFLLDQLINYGCKASIRFYTDQANQGAYFAPVVSTGFWTVNESKPVMFVTFGGVAGYQLVFDSKFVIDINLGVSHNNQIPNPFVGGSKLWPTFNFSVGWKL